MSVQAVVIHRSTGTDHEFVPTGVTGEWELKIRTLRGDEPGGLWQTIDVASAVVDAIYDEAA